MAPSVCFTAALTPSDPLAPWPVGHGTSLPAPAFQIVGDTAVRYEVNAFVVPEPSERCTTWIGVDGSEAPLLSVLMAASSHFLMVPAKMPASVSADSLRSLSPLTWYSMAMPPADHGMCSTGPPLALAAVSSSGFMTASDAPKSTVPALNCVMPAPEPTPW